MFPIYDVYHPDLPEAVPELDFNCLTDSPVNLSTRHFELRVPVRLLRSGKFGCTDIPTRTWPTPPDPAKSAIPQL
jgi:hypothetical protein